MVRDGRTQDDGSAISHAMNSDDKEVKEERDKKTIVKDMRDTRKGARDKDKSQGHEERGKKKESRTRRKGQET